MDPDDAATDALYKVSYYEGQDDYLSDDGLDAIGRLVAKLPKEGFDLASMQGHPSSVTATIRFDGCPGPVRQITALEAVLSGATVLRTLHTNLVSARAALATCRCRAVEDKSIQGAPMDPDYEYATVRSDDAAKWVGRDGWEVAEKHATRLRRRKPETASADIWAEMQRLRAVLDERGDLCGTCGCYLDPAKPHSAGGLGYCVLRMDRAHADYEDHARPTEGDRDG